MKETLNERIKKLRKKKGMTQLQLADKLGVTDKAVSKWEVGEGNPDLSLIPSIANFFDISVDELLQGRMNTQIDKNTTSFQEQVIIKGLNEFDTSKWNHEVFEQKDQYGYTVVDYIFKHESIDFLDYALDHWFHPIIIFCNEKEQIKFETLIKIETHEQLKTPYKLANLTNKNGKIFKTKKISLNSIFDIDKGYLNANLPILIDDIKQTLALVFKYQNLKLLQKLERVDTVVALSSDAIPSIIADYVKNKTFDKAFLDYILNWEYMFSYLLVSSISENETLKNILITSYLEKSRPLIGNHIEILQNLRDEKINKIFNLESKSYSVEEIDDECEEELIISLDIIDMIKQNKLKLLQNHLEQVSEKMKEFEVFIDHLVNKKVNDPSFSKLNKDEINQFNFLFKKTFNYRRQSFYIEGHLTKQQEEEILIYEQSLQDHTRLENILNESCKTDFYDIKNYLLGELQLTFNTSFSYKLNSLNKETLMILIPFLNQESCDEILTLINSDDIKLITMLLHSNAHFLLEKPVEREEGILFDYNLIDDRDTYQRYKDAKTEKYDKIRTLQMKLILNLISQ